MSNQPLGMSPVQWSALIALILGTVASALLLIAARAHRPSFILGPVRLPFDKPAWPRAGYTVHFSRMEAVEVDGVGMVATVGEMDADTVAFSGSQCWAGDATVVCPCGKLEPGQNFNVFVDRNDLVFAQGLSVGQG